MSRQGHRIARQDRVRNSKTGQCRARQGRAVAETGAGARQGRAVAETGAVARQGRAGQIRAGQGLAITG